MIREEDMQLVLYMSISMLEDRDTRARKLELPRCSRATVQSCSDGRDTSPISGKHSNEQAFDQSVLVNSISVMMERLISTIFSTETRQTFLLSGRAIIGLLNILLIGIATR